jgi:hypothetical protein
MSKNLKLIQKELKSSKKIKKFKKNLHIKRFNIFTKNSRN